MTIAYNLLLRNAKLDAISVFAGAGARLQLCDGMRPATGGMVTAVLAELTLGTPFAPAANAGLLLPTLPAATAGIIAGVVTWFRIVKADGSHVLDGSAGLTGNDLVLNTPLISVDVAVSVSAFAITCGNP
jgi:hypothetical protein